MFPTPRDCAVQDFDGLLDFAASTAIPSLGMAINIRLIEGVEGYGQVTVLMMHGESQKVTISAHHETVEMTVEQTRKLVATLQTWLDVYESLSPADCETIDFGD